MSEKQEKIRLTKKGLPDKRSVTSKNNVSKARHTVKNALEMRFTKKHNNDVSDDSDEFDDPDEYESESEVEVEPVKKSEPIKKKKIKNNNDELMNKILEKLENLNNIKSNEVEKKVEEKKVEVEEKKVEDIQKEHKIKNLRNKILLNF